MPFDESSLGQAQTVGGDIEQHLSQLSLDVMARVGSPANWTESLRSALGNLGVVDRLEDQQQQELAELVTRLLAVDKSFTNAPELKARNKQRQRWTIHGRRYVTNLVSQTKAAQEAVARLANNLKTLNIKGGAVETLSRLLAVLNASELRQRLLVDEVSRRWQRETDDVLVTLHDWFVAQRIRTGDAEYRAARISNEYWETDFKLTERDKDTARGCDTVRRRVERRRKRDKSNKTS